ncbi:hypothetical protein DPMN_106047 [Dreissena polymorpha]|uniref:Uncharacterized protein n=1 Tax=Dreissena polymorpha TaxID=45954 RepID=A0A9D4K4F6_DREPO|nr:hypothetical protein DPMN_106047 [Dreissena polymorpha]
MAYGILGLKINHREQKETGRGDQFQVTLSKDGTTTSYNQIIIVMATSAVTRLINGQVAPSASPPSSDSISIS